MTLDKPSEAKESAQMKGNADGFLGFSSAVSVIGIMCLYAVFLELTYILSMVEMI